jgi:hypothetical protein
MRYTHHEGSQVHRAHPMGPSRASTMIQAPRKSYALIDAGYARGPTSPVR